MSVDHATLQRRLRDATKEQARNLGVATARWRTPPDFLVLGTKRGGTTTLWRALAAHPAVFRLWPGPQKLKSSHFFTMRYQRGPAYYRSYFPLLATRALTSRWSNGPRLAGEASPLYLYDPRVPERVAEALPGVKGVVLLRNPVDRAYSHYQERRKEGVEPLAFGAALEAEEGRTAGELERMTADPAYYGQAFDWFSYRDRGVYAPQLSRWLGALPPDDLLVVRSEDFYRSPASLTAQVLRFLGVSAEVPKVDRYNEIPRSSMDPGIRRELAEFYRPHVAEVESLLARRFDWDLDRGGAAVEPR